MISQYHVHVHEILRKARQGISLEELDIESSRIRKGISGGIIIEILGTENKSRADALATRLREVLDNEEVTISRPTIKADIRISDFDNSVTSEEIRHIVAKKANCNIEDIKTSAIRWMRNVLGTIWIQCPLITANIITENGRLDGRRLRRNSSLRDRYNVSGAGHTDMSNFHAMRRWIGLVHVTTAEPAVILREAVLQSVLAALYTRRGDCLMNIVLVPQFAEWKNRALVVSLSPG